MFTQAGCGRRNKVREKFMNIDYAGNRKYFKPRNWKAAAALIFLGVVVAGQSIGLGLLMLLCGAGMLYYNFGGRKSDESIDRELIGQMANMRGHAQQHLLLDDDQISMIEPLILTGYVRGARGLLTKKGKDGQWRTSRVEGIVIFFDEDQLHAYSKRFSLVNENENVLQTTDEYFYQDVVSIATSTSEWTTPDGNVETYERFILTTSGGTRTECAMFDAGGAAQALQGARSLIREKKRVR